MVYIPSEQELEAQGGGKYTLMGEDWYLLEIKELRVERRPNPYDDGKLRDTALVKLDVISFENGDPLFDAEGNDTNDRLFFDFVEVEKLGMKPRPSKARKFIAGALNQPVANSIELDSWQDLVGKRLVGHAVIKKSGKNGIDDYKPVRNRRRPVTTEAAAPAPIAMPGEKLASAPSDDGDVSARAKEIFGDEADF